MQHYRRCGKRKMESSFI